MGILYALAFGALTFAVAAFWVAVRALVGIANLERFARRAPPLKTTAEFVNAALFREDRADMTAAQSIAEKEGPFRPDVNLVYMGRVGRTRGQIAREEAEARLPRVAPRAT